MANTKKKTGKRARKANTNFGGKKIKPRRRKKS